MNFFGFTAHEVTRFGGIVNRDDPTALPVGVAAVAKNVRFNLTSCTCRYGLQTQITGPNQVPINGLVGGIYTPENVGEFFAQLPIVFFADGMLALETSVGSGATTPIIGPLVSPPAGSQMIATQAENRAWMAFSNLETASGPMAVYDMRPGRRALEPYSQKPFGWNWVKNTPVIVGEYATPSVAGGNGHTYRCTQAGTTGGAEPIWLPFSGPIVDGTAQWSEYTPVIANVIPPPPGTSTILSGAPGSGAFPAGLDVYIMYTLVTPQGETLPGGLGKFVNTGALVALTFSSLSQDGLGSFINGIPAPYAPTGFNVYEAYVATGSPQPPNSAFQQIAGGPFPFSLVVVHRPLVYPIATAIAPPMFNGARLTPSGLQPPSTPLAPLRVVGGGGFPAGRDVYVIATLTNTNGETLPGVASVLINTAATDAVSVLIPNTTYHITGVNLYEADVLTGGAAPPTTSYGLVGSFQPGATATITAGSTGPPPPLVNTAGNAGNIAPDTPGGLRYATIEFENNNGMFSGFTGNSVISCFIDVPGFEIYAGNLPTGPGNVKARVVNFTTADGTNAGPLWYIPLADVSNGMPVTSTIVPDNVSTNATFNFTDQYLIANVATNSTDRFRVAQPPPAVDVYYSKSINRMVLTGCDGLASGHFISLAADLESFYNDTGRLLVAQGDGQACICAREYKGTLYSLKERSGHIISPNATDPSTWDVQQRWQGVGPCGPRAVDVGADFMFFVHRSWAYIFTGDQPQPINAEIPEIWNQINWDAEETIWVLIDEEQKEVRIGLPMGTSTVPDQVLTLNYIEGLSAPIHFSPYVGKEIATGECRKWSLDDIAANCAIRCERQLPVLASPFGAFRQSQLLFGSSSPDGTVQGIVPGIFNDNGAGIDQQYETCSSAELMTIQQLGGMSINARGVGRMKVSVMVARSFTTSPGQGQPGNPTNEIKMPDFILTPENYKGYSQGARGANERLRARFTNGKVADSWFDIKYCALFTRPIFSGRTAAGQ